MDVITENKKRLKSVKMIIDGGVPEKLTDALEEWDMLEFAIMWYVSESDKFPIYMEFSKSISVTTIKTFMKPFLCKVDCEFKIRTTSRKEIINAFLTNAYSRNEIPYVINKKDNLNYQILL
jgi:hypothetical protein